MVKKQYVTV